MKIRMLWGDVFGEFIQKTIPDAHKDLSTGTLFHT
jgi:hypothetical protein